MCAVQEQLANSTSEYKDGPQIQSRQTDGKSTAQKFIIKKRVETPQRLNPKQPPRRTVALKYKIRMDIPSFIVAPIASAVTFPTSALTASSQVVHTKNKQPF